MHFQWSKWYFYQNSLVRILSLLKWRLTSNWAETAGPGGMGSMLRHLKGLPYQGISKEMDAIWKTQTTGMTVSLDLILKDSKFTFHFYYSIGSWWFQPNWILVVKLDNLPKDRGKHLIKPCWKHQLISPCRVQHQLKYTRWWKKIVKLRWMNPRKEHDILHIQEVSTKRMKLPHVPCNIHLHITTNVAMFKPIQVT